MLFLIGEKVIFYNINVINTYTGINQSSGEKKDGYGSPVAAKSKFPQIQMQLFQLYFWINYSKGIV